MGIKTVNELRNDTKYSSSKVYTTQVIGYARGVHGEKSGKVVMAQHPRLVCQPRTSGTFH